MLSNPKWDKQTETKVDPFSLHTLIAWLERQPADEDYRYDCTGHCLLAQYFTAQGFKGVRMGPYGFAHSGAEADVKLPRIFNPIAQAEICLTGWPIPPELEPMTFGAALKRARLALSHSHA